MKISKQLEWWAGSVASRSVNAPYTNVVSHWSLNGSARDYDYGVNGPLLVNNVSQVAAKIANGYSWTANDSYITIPPRAALNFGSGGTDLPFSFSFWIYPTDTTTLRYIINKQTASVFEYAIWRDATGKIGFACYTDGSNYLYQLTNTTYASNNWYFIVCTYDGSKTAAGLKIYVNGSLSASTNNSSGAYTGMPLSTSALTFGQRANTLTGTTGFRGTIESISLFNFALGTTQISQLYNSGSGIAISTTAVLPTTQFYESGMFILATRAGYCFGTDNNNLYWSNDNGITWINKYAWGQQYNADGTPVYNKGIDMSYIFSDGTVLFSCGPLLFRSTDKLLTINSVTPKKADGVTNYTIHTPVNSARPGCYFQMYHFGNTHEQVNGNDILVWGNYCNVGSQVMGAAPVNIWATTDKGATVKAIYEFGQNPNYRDDGSAGGNNTGTLLGNASNTRIAKHVHSVARAQGTNDWYSCTGDSTANNENHWLKHTYNSGADTWSTTEIIVNQDALTKWFAGSLCFIDGTNVYWVSDNSTANERGMWTTAIANIGVSATNIADHGATGTVGIYLGSNGKSVNTFNAGSRSAQIATSSTSGTSPTYTTVTDASDTEFMVKWFPPDSRGYMKLNIGGFWTVPLKTVYIKV